MLHQVGDDDGGRAGHAGLAVDEKTLSTLMSFLCGTERQAVRGSVSFCTEEWTQMVLQHNVPVGSTCSRNELQKLTISRNAGLHFLKLLKKMGGYSFHSVHEKVKGQLDNLGESVLSFHCESEDGTQVVTLGSKLLLPTELSH